MPNRELTHLSLFSGIGGIDLAAEWAGFETVCFVEIDKYCQKVLKKHWPDVPIVEDIRDVTKEKVMAYTNGSRGTRKDNSQIDRCSRDEGGKATPILQPQGTEASIQSPITLITGGFPCQPVSVAGKRRGKEDDRWLWPEMLRVISDIRPTWIIAENVNGITAMVEYSEISDMENKEYTSDEKAEAGMEALHERIGRGILDKILGELEEIGYEVQPFVVPACAVNAPHRRDRIFIVAHSLDHCDRGGRGQAGEENSLQGVDREAMGGRLPSRAGEDVADTEKREGRGVQLRELSPNTSTRGNGSRQADWWAVESQLCRVDDGFSKRLDHHQWDSEWEGVPRVATGVKDRVNRLKALGNAVVAQQVYPILAAISEIERNHERNISEA